MSIHDQSSLNDYIEAEQLAKEAEGLIQRLNHIASKIGYQTQVLTDEVDLEDAECFFTIARDNIKEAILLWERGEVCPPIFLSQFPLLLAKPTLPKPPLNESRWWLEPLDMRSTPPLCTAVSAG